MKNSIAFLGVLCMIIMLSCQPKEPSETYKAEVAEELARQLNQLYFEAWQNEDLDSVLSFLAPDFMNMFSYGPAANVTQCRESFQEVFDTYSIEGVKYERTECFVDCDYAFEIGLFEQQWITRDNSDTLFFKLRSMIVFKKQPDGSWKMFRSIAQQ